MKCSRNTRWFVVFAALISTFVTPGRADPKMPQFDFIAQPRMIEIKANSQPVATYVYSDPQIPRPYFKDLFAPGAVRVSRHHPQREGLDPMDHPVFHPGLWLAFGDLSGADSWRNTDPVEHMSFVKAPWAQGDRAGFSVRNRYRHGDKTVCTEVCEYTFLTRPEGTLILWNSTFQSDREEFWFGDQEEMGLGVRVTTPIMVKPRKGDNHLKCHGRILDSQGRQNQKNIWGKQAQWCDYSGPVEGQFAGVTIMPDPDNTYACWWHARDYGFFAANCFGRAAFKAGPPSKIPVKRGESFNLSFGILLHAHPEEENLDLPGAYQDYLKIVREKRGNSTIGGQG